MSLDVSLLLDGQLPPDEARNALEQAGSEPALRDRFTLYGLVGDALRGNSTPDDGFSVRLLQRMRREGARMEPNYDPLAGQ
jgi:hypothetical protein